MAHQKANEGGGVIWCHDTGRTCITFTDDDKTKNGVFFLQVASTSPVFDGPLGEMAKTMNRIVNEVQETERSAQNRDPKLKLGFLLTGSGFLPVWKREVAYDERLEDLVDKNSLTDLDGMSYDRLGAHLRILSDEGTDGGGNLTGEWRAWWRDSAGIVHCSGAGGGCFVTHLEEEMLSEDSPQAGIYFPATHPDSPVFDPVLNKLAADLNNVVSETQAREKRNSSRDSRAVIGFIVASSGFVPVWKITQETYEQPDSERIYLHTMTPQQLDEYLQVRS